VQELSVMATLAATLHDVWREGHPDEAESFTVWNECTNARATNYGLRIDYVLASGELRELCSGCEILYDLPRVRHRRFAVHGMPIAAQRRVSKRTFEQAGHGFARYCCHASVQQLTVAAAMQKWSDHAAVTVTIGGVPQHAPGHEPPPCALSSRHAARGGIKALLGRAGGGTRATSQFSEEAHPDGGEGAAALDQAGDSADNGARPESGCLVEEAEDPQKRPRLSAGLSHDGAGCEQPAGKRARQASCMHAFNDRGDVRARPEAEATSRAHMASDAPAATAGRHTCGVQIGSQAQAGLAVVKPDRVHMAGKRATPQQRSMVAFLNKRPA
jgi:hypothetical protein